MRQVPPAFSAITRPPSRRQRARRDPLRAGAGQQAPACNTPCVTGDESKSCCCSTCRMRIRPCSRPAAARVLMRGLWHATCGRALKCRGHVIALRAHARGSLHRGRGRQHRGIRRTRIEAGEDLQPFLRPVVIALTDLTELNISQGDAADLMQGRSVLIRGATRRSYRVRPMPCRRGQIIALGEPEKGRFSTPLGYSISAANA